jgi:hypothetical protein
LRPGRTTADNRDVVFSGACAGLKAEVICNVAQLGPNELLPVGEPQHRAIAIRWASSGPKRRQLRRIGRQPVEGDLVARQKPAQVTACSVPAVTDYHHARLVRFGSNALEPSHALARKRTDLSRDVLRYCRGCVVLLKINLHHA